MRILLIIGLLALLGTSQAQSFLEVKVKKGEGAYSILRKYSLLSDANLQFFYCINKLKDDSELRANHNYKLPILIHKYDKKSIRTSLKIQDREKAEAIKNYNENALKKKLKGKSFTSDLALWVPLQYKSKAEQDKSIGRCIKPENTAVAKSVDKQIQEQTKEDLRILVAETKLLTPPLPPPFQTIPVKSELVSFRQDSSFDEELEDEAYLSPIVKKVANRTFTYSLFGKENEEVQVYSDRLVDKVYYIVPGHGGPDPGAVAEDVEGKYTMCEDEYAYDVCLRLAKALMEESATVYMIVQDKNDGIRDEQYLDCDKDERVYGGAKMPEAQLARLQQGTSKINKLHAQHKAEGIVDDNQIMISVHIDSRSENARQDVFFYYYSESKLEKRIATHLQKTFAKKYKKYRKDREYTGTISSRPLFVLRKSTPNSVFVELANIRNESDRKRLLFSKNRQLLAEWLAEGLTK